MVEQTNSYRGQNLTLKFESQQRNNNTKLENKHFKINTHMLLFQSKDLHLECFCVGLRFIFIFVNKSISCIWLRNYDLKVVKISNMIHSSNI